MADPQKPTRKELESFLGRDNRLIKAFESLFRRVPDDIVGGFEEVLGIINMGLTPSISRNSGAIAELNKQINRHIQFKSAAYTLKYSDSGVVATGDTEFTLPDATTVTDLDFFLQNAGSDNISLVTFESQKIAGADVILISAGVPFSTGNVKSDGANWILLSDRVGTSIQAADYWIDDTADNMVTDTGENIVFVI